MSNLPAKQSVFAKMRNKIIDAGLRHKVTRRLMVNFLPGYLRLRLSQYTLKNDDPNFTITRKIISSMNEGAIKQNLHEIFAYIQKFNHFDTNDTVNIILDNIPQKHTELACKIMLTSRMWEKEPVFGKGISQENAKRIIEGINLKNKTDEEIDSLLDVSSFKYSNGSKTKLASNLFENLKPEHKKEHFSEFVLMLESADGSELKKAFEQIPGNDRLEQYKKILEVYKEKDVYNGFNVTKCFASLSEENKREVLRETFELIKANNNDSKALYLSDIIANIPLEEQKKYFKEVLPYCNKNEQVETFISSIDKSLQEQIVIDVITKVRENASKEYNSRDIENVFIKLEPDVLNNGFTTILSGDLEKENAKFVAEWIDRLLLNEKFKERFKNLEKEEKHKYFENIFIVFDKIGKDDKKFGDFFDELDEDIKIEIFEYYAMSSSNKFKYVIEILKKYNTKELNQMFKWKIVFDEKIISELMQKEPDLFMKLLLFDKEVDREKIFDLSNYEQPYGTIVNINLVIQELYKNSRQEFNQLLSELYDFFTYNNVPEFMKTFKFFQLGKFHNEKNDKIKSFAGKTIEERDILILEDLFKISLDSNNRSLRDFANIIIEGKQITTKLQSNPEEKIKSLDIEELALLNQYRDTLFDLHNLTKDIRNTDRPKIEKSDDVIKDLRTLIAIYSDNKEHNPNSKNVVFNPNKIMDELFEGFITTTISPEAMLEYMDSKKKESDERHLKIEQRLKDGTMHLEPGDFIKGVSDFDNYLPSLLDDGLKCGEFNQKYSHSDVTKYDADFGYISQVNITEAKKKNKEANKEDLDITDYDVIQTTISKQYGKVYIVLKQYEDRLQYRCRERFGQGTFTGEPDYYSIIDNEDNPGKDRYIRTGIPVTDIDYIVSENWNPQYGYEMAMAGIYIPVINPKGEVVFTSDKYKKIREEMRGLSHYSADNIVVSKDAANMEALYAIYRNISKKSPEEVEKEIETVKGIVDGKIDTITEQKKKAITQFIKDFFKTHGIRVADDLSQNLSSKSVELIDTGSTGRGTNIPGDDDFNFMLRHNLPEKLIEALANKFKSLVTPDSEFARVSDGFRTKNVVLPTGEVVDIDVTTAKKSLSLVYSSDMCVRDRLNNIRENNPESYNYVQANIIMAKKILKAAGIYKKSGSSGATEHGGFGGIGVENWILQNGGSFKTAIDTFLQAAKESSSYEEFKEKYPIFDFGFNHRDLQKQNDNRFSAFFTNKSDKPGVGFEYAKVTLTEIQKAFEMEKEQPKMNSPLFQSISPQGLQEAGAKRPVLTFRSSYSSMRMLLAKHMSLRTKDTEQQVTIDRKGEEVLDD